MNETVSRPKKRNLCTANEASDPSTSAIVGRHRATAIDVPSAPRSVESCQRDGEPVAREELGGHEPAALLERVDHHDSERHVEEGQRDQRRLDQHACERDSPS